MCPYSYYSIMRTSKDPRHLRFQIVLSVEKSGIRETARAFHVSRTTVRKWYRRWQDHGYQALEARSRRPRRSPNATPPKERQKLVSLKHTYKRIGAEAIRTLENLERSPRTIRKIWREEGVSSRKRRKKHQTKQCLREVKKRWALFQQIDEDTKDLWDIPEYYIQMKRKRLPRVQYTARDVTSGLLFMGFAQDKTLTNAALFADYLNTQLQRLGADLSHTTRQTDNGSEYIGSVTAKTSSDYTKTVEAIPGQQHATIPPGAYTFQADVETVHNLVEMEFYEIEHFNDPDDFLAKATTYQLFFNLVRPNSYKEHKTPWQLAQDKQPALSQQIAMIPPVFIDQLLEKHVETSLGVGHHVPSTPCG
jgi:transposase